MSAVQHFDLSSPAGDENFGLGGTLESGRNEKGASEAELRSYAKYLGIKDNEYEAIGKLRSLAKEGLSAPLPKGWEQGRTPEKGQRR